MDDVLKLICRKLVQNDFGGFTEESETEREIYGTVSSITRAEWYDAGRKGMNPEIAFTTPIVNYCGETEAEYHGIRYGIYRTYLVQESDMIELYLERKAGAQ